MSYHERELDKLRLLLGNVTLPSKTEAHAALIEMEREQEERPWRDAVRNRENLEGYGPSPELTWARITENALFAAIRGSYDDRNVLPWDLTAFDPSDEKWIGFDRHPEHGVVAEMEIARAGWDDKLGCVAVQATVLSPHSLDLPWRPIGNEELASLCRAIGIFPKHTDDLLFRPFRAALTAEHGVAGYFHPDQGAAPDVTPINTMGPHAMRPW
jgi:hypothetical protein